MDVSPPSNHRGSHQSREEHTKASCPRSSSYPQSAPRSVRSAGSVRLAVPLPHSGLYGSLSLNYKNSRSGSPPFPPFVKTFHASALLRGASLSITSDGLRLRALQSGGQRSMKRLRHGAVTALDSAPVSAPTSKGIRNADRESLLRDFKIESGTSSPGTYNVISTFYPRDRFLPISCPDPFPLEMLLTVEIFFG